ncbi:hypothetical protein Pan216_07010 [Planctomycetes bacterium Pan216]|uniref:Uncharacterized protein n=1 Tax=Kolteria novifilia TaxID=2527975 RepID=A0A518AYR6_9BACT|nr:hypothetical protein Pan216_07010 [Planctomycetes bacterium Pan216]
MQKAVIVRNLLSDSVGQGWSYEVDAADETATNPLRELLEKGWRVVKTCPMPSELDSCCLVVLEDPETNKNGDLPLSAMNALSSWHRLQSAAKPASSHEWDGETIPLQGFGIDG